MLTARFDRKRGKLEALFDIPAPVSIESHPEMKHLKATLADRAGATIIHRGNEWSGFSSDIGRWMEFIEMWTNVGSGGFQRAICRELPQTSKDEQGEGLHVNFHQNPFDTPERYWRFILSQGHFMDYFFNRMDWYLGPKLAIVTPFPLHVDLESASTCNMSCPMCYRGMLNETGQMDIELFKKVVDECAAHDVFSIRLSWRGETLTHPEIKDMIAYATRKIKNVSFLTNAFYLDDGMIDFLIKSRVSYVAVSFDGIRETYEAIRHPARFEESYEKLALLRDKKKRAESTLPQVRLCTIWPAIKDDPDAYYHSMKEVSDYIVCNPYINFKGPMTIKSDFICQYPWERIVVAFNGNAQCCTGWNADDIILGNVRESTIAEMWNSKRMDEIRTVHTRGKRMDIHSCAECRHGAQGDPDISIWDILERRY